MNTCTFSITFEAELPDDSELDANVENICADLQEAMICLPGEKILEYVIDKNKYQFNLSQSGMTKEQAREAYESMLKFYKNRQQMLHELWESRKILIG